MKEKDLLKALRNDVLSIMPNCLQAVKDQAVTPEKNINVHVQNTQQPTKKARLTLAFACCMLVVFSLMICMPFIIKGRDGGNGALNNYNQPSISSEVDEENKDK